MARLAKYVQRCMPKWTGTCVDCGETLPAKSQSLWCDECFEANLPRWAMMLRLPACALEGCEAEVTYDDVRARRSRFCSRQHNRVHNRQDPEFKRRQRERAADRKARGL